MNNFALCIDPADNWPALISILSVFLNRALGRVYPSCPLIFPANTVCTLKTCRHLDQLRGVCGRTRTDRCSAHTHTITHKAVYLFCPVLNSLVSAWCTLIKKGLTQQVLWCLPFTDQLILLQLCISRSTAFQLLSSV